MCWYEGFGFKPRGGSRGYFFDHLSLIPLLGGEGKLGDGLTIYENIRKKTWSLNGTSLRLYYETIRIYGQEHKTNRKRTGNTSNPVG